MKEKTPKKDWAINEGTKNQEQQHQTTNNNKENAEDDNHQNDNNNQQWTALVHWNEPASSSVQGL